MTTQAPLPTRAAGSQLSFALAFAASRAARSARSRAASASACSIRATMTARSSACSRAARSRWTHQNTACPAEDEHEQGEQEEDGEAVAGPFVGLEVVAGHGGL